MGPFKNFVKIELEGGGGGEAKGSCYSCSKDTSSLGCYYIKKKYPMRQNGFFWIKTKCMPEPARVFCDFTNGEGNFYLY